MSDMLVGIVLLALLLWAVWATAGPYLAVTLAVAFAALTWVNNSQADPHCPSPPSSAGRTSVLAHNPRCETRVPPPQ